MDKEKTVRRLAKAVKHGKFAWEKYVMGDTWHGLYIETQVLHCSYGQIGYTVSIDRGRTEICHDWELSETTIRTEEETWDGEKWVTETKSEKV